MKNKSRYTRPQPMLKQLERQMKRVREEQVPSAQKVRHGTLNSNALSARSDGKRRKNF